MKKALRRNPMSFTLIGLGAIAAVIFLVTGQTQWSEWAGGLVTFGIVGYVMTL